MNLNLKNIFQLTRFSLSMAIAFSAMAGTVIFSHKFNITTIFVFMGVLMLSGAASALNQYQERGLDAKMGRTQNRPLPANRISSTKAILIVLFLTFSGTLLLYFGTTPMAAFLGLFNMLWYNAVYTPLKTKTAYVVLPGALTGAVPPIIGWTACGGNLFDPTIISLAVFMFLWQIPHFWLLLLKYGKQYELAGFASLTNVVSENHAKAIIFIWVAGTSVSSMLFPLFRIISNVYIIVFLAITNFILIYFFYRVVYNQKKTFQFRPAFYTIYLYQVIILIILMTGSNQN